MTWNLRLHKREKCKVKRKEVIEMSQQFFISYRRSNEKNPASDAIAFRRLLEASFQEEAIKQIKKNSSFGAKKIPVDTGAVLGKRKK